MGNDFITISKQEYKEMLEASIRIQLFAEFLNSNNHISREECGNYLGFIVTNKED